MSNIDYLTPIFVNLSQPVLTKPNLTSKNKTSTFEGGVTRIVTTLSQEEIEEYNIKLKEFLKDEKAVKTIKRLLHNVIWGQCLQMMQTKLRGNEKLEQVDLDDDVVELLKMVQGACREMTTNASLHDAVDETKRRYYIYK